MSQNIISESRDRFSQNDYVIDNRESTKSYQKLLELFSGTILQLLWIDQG